MKQITIATLAALMLGTAQADYTLKFPLEQAQGGSLPNGSITITNQAPIENWVAIEPLLSDWYTIGEPFDCRPDGWVPEPSTIAEGEVFTQTNQWCYIREERTVQSREQETTTGIIRNVGGAEIESWNLDASDTREAVGTLIETWESFADERGLPKDWNNLQWASKGLNYLPNAPYPITSVNTLNLGNTQITNVDGLSNLTSVNTLNLPYNQLTNVNGLANVKINNLIAIDNTYAGPKLAASTRFCLENELAVFRAGYAQKSQLCESQ
ncbi:MULTISPECIES: leucine-rich repeat domain-containing protein [unclassified Pseudomonas]|uniref:leucine-rich repeat domain-containing protein n=1 Tax=unclassified Pseudomonas TaxID=196821 RepID=UPI002579FB67|nr:MULTISPECIES: leucine-rich repeat domain-containing protein [unclassified Pseudomonas]